MARLVDTLAPGGTLFVVGHATRNITDGVGGPEDASVCSSSNLRPWTTKTVGEGRRFASRTAELTLTRATRREDP